MDTHRPPNSQVTPHDASTLASFRPTHDAAWEGGKRGVRCRPVRVTGGHCRTLQIATQQA